MSKEKEINYQKKPKKENLSRFKGALKRIRSGIRSRAMPFVLVGSLVAISPAFKQQEAYAEDSIAKMEQIKKDNPSINNEEMLLYILYLNHSYVNQQADKIEGMVENISKLIERNKENRIFCITLNSVLTDVLNNPKSKDYCMNATNSRMIIKDKIEDPAKMLIIASSGKNGAEVHMFFYSGVEGKKDIIINTDSTNEDVEKLRLELSKFFDSMLPGIILINNELDKNRK